MKTLFCLITSLLILNHLTFAQEKKSFYSTPYDNRNSGSFSMSSSLISVSIGFPNEYVIHDTREAFPSLYVKYEHGFMRDEFGLGGYASTGWGSFTGKKGKINFTGFSISSDVFYHFNRLIPAKRLDVYVGLGIGYRHVDYDAVDPTAKIDTVDDNFLGIFKLGVRYSILPLLSLHAETGFDGASGINTGITFKLK